MLSPISPILSRSSVESLPSSTPQRWGMLRAAAPVLLALVLGVGIAGCDDVSTASSDAASSAAPAESQKDAGGGDSAGSEEVPAEESGEEPAAEPTEDSSGWSGWLGSSDSGEGSESGAGSESESQKKSESAPEPQKESESAPEPQKEFYANCKEAKAAGAAPMYKGDPGYRPELDRDGDGSACDK